MPGEAPIPAIRKPPSLYRPAPVAFWTSVPISSRVVGAAVVFFLFATVGFVTLQMDISEHHARDIFLSVLVSGIFAVGYAVSAVSRRYWGFAVLGTLQFLVEFWIHSFQGAPRSLANNPDALHKQLIWLGVGAIISIILGYVLLIYFVQRLGRSYFRVQTEVKLAGEIHASLVPTIQTRSGPFEFFGVSQPSGEVGGDLVDFAESNGKWTAYIADVSGHGVSSGVLMAMFKTAMRTRLHECDSPAQALAGVHRALFSLKPPQMFVTVAVLQGTSTGLIQFASAAHPPVLHFQQRSGNVSEIPSQDAPLGLFDGQSFSESTIESSPGDVFLILSDGLSEVFDRHGRELGLDPLKSALAQDARLALPDLGAQLRAVGQKFGVQADDQTILLVRHVGSA